jgi:N-acetylmuramoyl-L-alanine amidase
LLPARTASSVVAAGVAAWLTVGATARSQPPTAPVTAPASPLVVAIDPGHGGSNLGAARSPARSSEDGAGLPAGRGTVFEKEITLEIARRLRSRLEEQVGFRVVLCRGDDVMVPIRARARCVESAQAALFISLHTNASPPGVAAGSRRGFEIYVLSPQEVEDDAAVAALRPAAEVDGIWAAHEAHATAERAIWAARLVEKRLKERLGAHASRGIRQTGAALDVLRGTGAPGVLVEVGFIDHPEEGAWLASASGQDLLAAALAAAISDFARH